MLMTTPFSAWFPTWQSMRLGLIFGLLLPLELLIFWRTAPTGARTRMTACAPGQIMTATSTDPKTWVCVALPGALQPSQHATDILYVTSRGTTWATLDPVESSDRVVMKRHGVTLIDYAPVSGIATIAAPITLRAGDGISFRMQTSGRIVCIVTVTPRNQYEQKSR